MAYTGLLVRFKLEAVNSEGSTLSNNFLSALVASLPDDPSAAPVRLASSHTSLTVELPIITADGGLSLEAYELVLDNGLAGEYNRVNADHEPALQRIHHLTKLTNGLVYRLKYRTRNSLGWSGYSPTASLLVAGIPSPPAKPTIVSTSAT